MTEQTKWEVEQLKKREEKKDEKNENRFQKLEEKVDALVIFKTATVEKLLMILQMLEELKEGNRVIKRIFITSLVGSVLSGITAAIVWAIQN